MRAIAKDMNDSRLRPGEIAIGVIIGRTSEYFDFFVYAIASVMLSTSTDGSAWLRWRSKL